jgi:PAB-dependent poly(A)-specific ribonuclease subunit 2
LCLQYPDKKDEGAIRTKPSFADCLRDSLKTSGEVRAWCEGHKAYTRMSSARHPKALPRVSLF